MKKIIVLTMLIMLMCSVCFGFLPSGTGKAPKYYIAASDSDDSDKRVAYYICDGTDDNVEINAALGDNRVVTLAAGTYNITNEIRVDYNDIIFEGQGRGTVINRVDANDAAHAPTYNHFSCVTQLGANHNIIIRNMTIKNNGIIPPGGINDPRGKCIFMFGIRDYVVGSDLNNYRVVKSHTSSAATRPITGANYQDYWYPYAGTGASETWVTDTNYVGTDAAYNFLIENVEASGSNAECICVDYAFNVTIRNCYCYDGGWSGITLAWGQFGNVYDNYIYNCGKNTTWYKLNWGISILGWPNTNVYSNTVINSQAGGIGISSSSTMNRADDINIYGNNIQDCTGTGNIQASLQSACATTDRYNRRIVFKDNHVIVPTGQSGTLLQYTKDFIVSGNTFNMRTATNNWILTDSTVSNGKVFDNMYTATANTNIPSTSAGVIWSTYNPIYFDSIKNGSANYIHAPLDATLLGAANQHTDVNQPDCPRQLVFTTTHTNLTSVTVYCVGTNHLGVYKTQVVTMTAATSWTGVTDPMMSIVYVRVESKVGTGVGDTVSCGVNNVLGLGRKLLSTTDVAKVTQNGANITLPTVSTDGTVTLTSVTDGDNFAVYTKQSMNWPLLP